jgi:hypothetical protein
MFQDICTKWKRVDKVGEFHMKWTLNMYGSDGICSPKWQQIQFYKATKPAQQAQFVSPHAVFP